MKTKTTLGWLILLLAFAGTAAQSAETAAQRDDRLRWWREARFGMFVHWGLYSGLAGTWNGQPVGTEGGMEWIQQRVKADTDTYARAAIPRFKPKPGFAQEWAALAKAAGCRYVVFTTKHHDGFALHDSKVSDYDAGSVLGRDLVREIVDALRAEGLRVGFYHSVIDWHHDQYAYALSAQLPHPLHGQPYPNGQRDHARYLDYLHAQVNELASNYGPVDILWWDYSAQDFQGEEAWRAFGLMDRVRQLQPAVIMNNRLFRIPEAGWTGMAMEATIPRIEPKYGDFLTPEQHIPPTGMPGVDWETCMTLNTTWGFSEHDHAWKSNETLIRNLIDIASKGGNYLLNIGPEGRRQRSPGESPIPARHWRLDASPWRVDLRHHRQPVPRPGLGPLHQKSLGYRGHALPPCVRLAVRPQAARPRAAQPGQPRAPAGVDRDDHGGTDRTRSGLIAPGDGAEPGGQRGGPRFRRPTRGGRRSLIRSPAPLECTMKPAANDRPRVLLADDHAILLDAFKQLLEPTYEIVGAVTDGRALVEAAHRLKPDVIVADISMPQLNGLDACEELTGQLPDTRLIFLTVNEDPDVAAEAVRRGAAGYLLKKAAASELFKALERVLDGRFYITPLITSEPMAVFIARAQHSGGRHKLSLRQREVLQLLAEGRSMKEAADLLELSPRTIAFHKYTMMEQLGFKTGAELVQYAVQLGLVGPGTAVPAPRQPGGHH